jgi:hypothetical protein
MPERQSYKQCPAAPVMVRRVGSGRQIAAAVTPVVPENPHLDGHRSCVPHLPTHRRLPGPPRRHPEGSSCRSLPAPPPVPTLPGARAASASDARPSPGRVPQRGQLSDPGYPLSPPRVTNGKPRGLDPRGASPAVFPHAPRVAVRVAGRAHGPRRGRLRERRGAAWQSARATFGSRVRGPPGFPGRCVRGIGQMLVAAALPTSGWPG